MMLRLACMIVVGFALIGCAQRPDYRAHVDRGVKFLVGSQQPDGSWGTGTVTRGYEVYSMVPGSHDSYRVATTALCVMALREAGEGHARAKGVEYLLTHGEARRDSGDLLYNVWAHTYALQALSIEMRHSDDPRLKAAAEKQLTQMVRYATYLGGWNYYDFRAQTREPSMDPTSFGTAAGLAALYEARKSGILVPQQLIDRSIRQLLLARLPDGMFMYGSGYKYIPRLPANKPQGAVGRTQACNFALWRWGSPQCTRESVISGLDLFFKHHHYLEMGRKRPFPHESWFQNSGYYYYFDHYYAAELLELLAPEDRSKYVRRLAEKIYTHQEPDGSWWDYPMWDYDKPYGTAYAVLSLLRLQGIDK